MGTCNNKQSYKNRESKEGFEQARKRNIYNKNVDNCNKNMKCILIVNRVGGRAPDSIAYLEPGIRVRSPSDWPF